MLKRENLVDSLGLSPASVSSFSTHLEELLQEDSSYDSASYPSPSSSSSSLSSPASSPSAHSALVPALAPSSPWAGTSDSGVVLATPLGFDSQKWLVVSTTYWRCHTSVAVFDRTLFALTCAVHEGGPNGPVTKLSYNFSLSVVNCLGSRLHYPVRADTLPERVSSPFSTNEPLERYGSSASYSFRVGPTALYAEFRVAVNGEVHSFGTTVRNARTQTEKWTMDTHVDASGCTVMQLMQVGTNLSWEFSLSTVSQANCANVPQAFEVRRPSAGRYAFLVHSTWRGVVTAVPTPNGAVHLFFLPGVEAFVGGVSVTLGDSLMTPTMTCNTGKRPRDE